MTEGSSWRDLPTRSPDPWPEAWHTASAWREALARALAIRSPTPPLRARQADARPSAVLAVLSAPEPGVDPSVLLTLRAPGLASHQGQIAFPGGVVEAEDASPRATALRECREEVGIASDRLEVLGELPAFSTLTTHFWVTPVVALVRDTTHDRLPTIVPNAEIADALWVSLPVLSKSPGMESRWRKHLDVWTPVFDWPGRPAHWPILWGATAYVLQNLLDRLSRVQ